MLVVGLRVSRLRPFPVPFRGTGSICSARGCLGVHEGVWARLRSALVTPWWKKQWEGEQGPSCSASSHVFGIGHVVESGWG